jgi:ubiquinone/menaquinone biosynthesis C-methylase UbiE
LSSDFIPALRFSALTRFYDPVVRLTTRERRVKQALVEAAAIPEGATILDLGCGTGTLTVWLKQQHPNTRVIGLDADPVILAIARGKAEQASVDVEFIEANAIDIPLPENSAQRVVSSLFFHHLLLDQKAEVLSEIFRVLAPDGELHISDWGEPSNPLMRAAFFFVQILDGFATTRDSVEGRLPGLVEAAGAQHVRNYDHFDTVLGTLRLLQATK